MNLKRSLAEELWHKLELYPLYFKRRKVLQREAEEIKAKISDLYTAKGISFDGIPSENPSGQDKFLNYLISEQKEIENKFFINEGMIKSLDTIKNLCDPDVQEYIEKRFIENRSWTWMEHKFYMSHNGIRNRIMRNLEKLVK